MSEQSEILGTLKGRLGLAGKLAGKGFNEISGLIKSEDVSNKSLSGVYWERGPWSIGSDLIPEIDYTESQDFGKFKVSLVKRVTTSKADRAFMQACGCCVYSNQQGMENNAREAVESDPQYTDGYFMLGCLLLELDRADEAITYFQKALLCQQGLGTKFKKYLPSFRMSLPLTPSSSISIYPDLLGVNVLLALAQRKVGQIDTALITIQQLLSVMPTDPLALFFLSVLRIEAGQFANIVDELSDILPVSTIQIANLILLGYACYKLGDVVTARDIYRNALEKSDYDNVLRLDLQYALAKSLGKTGDVDIEGIYRDCPSYQPFFKRLGIRVKDDVEEKGRTIATDKGDSSAFTTVALKPGIVSDGNSSSKIASKDMNYKATPERTISNSSENVLASSFIPPVVPVDVREAEKKGSNLSNVPMPSSSVVSTPAVESVTSKSDTSKVEARVTLNMVIPNPTKAQDTVCKEDKRIVIPEPVHVVEPIPPRIDDKVRLCCVEKNIEIILGKGQLKVGREEGDIALPFDVAVSRNHARIIYDQMGRYLVEDLNSMNGTWLNGYRLNGGSYYEINRGDVIQFGTTKFRML